MVNAVLARCCISQVKTNTRPRRLLMNSFEKRFDRDFVGAIQRERERERERERGVSNNVSHN